MDKGSHITTPAQAARAAVLLDLYLGGVTDIVTETPCNWLHPISPSAPPVRPAFTPPVPAENAPETAPKSEPKQTAPTAIPAAKKPSGTNNKTEAPAAEQAKAPPLTLWTHGTGHKLLVLTAALPAQQNQQPLDTEATLLFSRMLAAIQLDMADVTFLACAVAQPPPAAVLQAWHPALAREIGLYQHQHILTLGKVAGNLVHNSYHPMADLRLPPLAPPTKALQKDVVCTYHPSNLLKQPLLKKLAWSDLCTLKNALQPQQKL